MPTRYYLPSSGTPPVSPATSAEWDFGTASRRNLVRTRISSGALSFSGNKPASNVSNQDGIWAQYISEPLDPQTISGTVKGYLRAWETNTAANARMQVIIRVVSRDGTVVRGTLYGGDLTTGTANPTSEFTTAATSRQAPRGLSQNLSPLDIEAGDRLVIEYGYRIHTTSATAYTISGFFGDGATSDLLENQTTTTANNPWIEFSTDIYAEGTTPTSGGGAPVIVGTPTKNVGASTIHTFSHTVPSGSDRLLLVAVSALNAGSGSPTATYGGVALTEIATTAAGSFHRTTLLALVAPAVGTANLVVTGSINADRIITATNLTGVHQSNPYGTPDALFGYSNSSAITLTSATDELVVDAISWYDGSFVPAAGQTLLIRVEEGDADYFAMSTKPGAASVTSTWTNTVVGESGHAGIAIKPVATGGGPTTIEGAAASTGSSSASAAGTLTTRLQGSAASLGSSSASAAGTLAIAASAASTGTAVASATGSLTTRIQGAGSSLGFSLTTAAGKLQVSASAASTGTSATNATGTLQITLQGAASSTGVSSTTGAGKLQYRGTGASTGTSSASATGTTQTTIQGSAASIGISSASGAGKLQVKGTAASIGVSSTSGAGKITMLASGASLGSSSALAASALQATIQGAGSSIGISSTTGAGTLQHRGAGTSTGIATAAATGRMILQGAGSSTGTSTASGIAKSILTAAGSSTGISSTSASGALRTTLQGAASSTGISSASAIGSLVARIQGAAASIGSSSVSGTGSITQRIQGSGSSIGISSTAAAARMILRGSGSTIGIALASGRGTLTIQTEAAAEGTSSAIASAVSYWQAAGSSIGTSLALIDTRPPVRLGSLERYGPGEYTMDTIAAGPYILDTTAPGDLQAETMGPSMPLLLTREANVAIPITLTREGPPAGLVISRIHEEMNDA